jgi:hypothetical protein
VTVTVHGSEKEALDFGAQNVIAVKNGDAIPGKADSFVEPRGLFSGSSAPDVGTWNYQSFSTGTPRHEFTHLLGVDDRNSGPSVSNNTHLVMPNANNDDFNWAAGGVVDAHRRASRPIVPRSDYQEVRGGGRAFERGAPQSHRSRQAVRAAKLFWN